MYRIIVCIVTIFAAVNGAGEITFMHHPTSVVFRGNEGLEQSYLKEVYSASLGFTTKQTCDWSGINVINPFHYAEAVVALIVDGIDAISDIKGHHFPLATNEDEFVTWLELERRLRNRFPTENSTVMRVELSDAVNAVEPLRNSVGGTENVLPNTQFLDANISEDHQYLSEISFLKRIIKRVRAGFVSHDGIPDIYWFMLPGLHAVCDVHGPDSEATIEAKDILRETIEDLNSAFKLAYDGRVLVSVLTSDVSHTRQTRSVRDGNNTDEGPGNLSKEYSSDYPVIFNILLWLMVAFFMSLIAVSISIASMDPGRDSIIYRMTSNRMKKDN